MLVNYNKTEFALKLVGMSQKCNVKFWLPMRSTKWEIHATFIKKSKQHFQDFFHFGESTSLLLGFFVKKMSFKNKSKYFHIMQAKKRKKQDVNPYRA